MAALLAGLGIIALTLVVSTAQAGTRSPIRHHPLRATAPLCAPTAAPTLLVVDRHDAIPQNHTRFSFPDRFTVRNTASVQEVQHVLCRLPAWPTGNRQPACPADIGITYSLVFVDNSHRFQPVTADATGCRAVRGLGKIRWSEESDQLWRALARAMDLPSRTRFAGWIP